jgi:hypothetical protein
MTFIPLSERAVRIGTCDLRRFAKNTLKPPLWRETQNVSFMNDRISSGSVPEL